jgi:putative membrane protein
MMGWNDGMGWGWGGWLVSGILMILFWGLVIWGLIALIRSVTGSHQQAPLQMRTSRVTTSAEQILAERFARGEIDAEEYGTRLAMLRSPVGAGASTSATEDHRSDRTVA